MAKRQLSIYCDDSVVDRIDDFSSEMDAESRSEAGKELLLDGVKRYERRQRMPPGGNLLKEAVGIGAISTVIALSIGLGLASYEVLQLAGGFAGVSVMIGMIYGAMVVRARGVV